MCRSYVYVNETRLYYLQSRYYNPAVGRFLNADVVYDLDAGLEGYNLFPYCANDPVGRIDISGRDSEKADLDLDDDEICQEGAGGLGWSSAGGYAYASNVIDTSYTYNVDLSQAANSSLFSGGILSNGYTASGYVGGEKTEVHHVVEQCQKTKSGFSNADIQAESNKVTLPYSVHRRISGHYSSIQEYTGGMRVRNWLAGKSFEYQTNYGWYVISMYME